MEQAARAGLREGLPGRAGRRPEAGQRPSHLKPDEHSQERIAVLCATGFAETQRE